MERITRFYDDQVAMVLMSLWWSCCYGNQVAIVIMLLWQSSCYGDHVSMSIKLLWWSCFYDEHVSMVIICSGDVYDADLLQLFFFFILIQRNVFIFVLIHLVSSFCTYWSFLNLFNWYNLIIIMLLKCLHTCFSYITKYDIMVW